MLIWVDQNSSDIGWNVAADEALLVACENGVLEQDSILRIWRQRTWAVVLGASGKIAEEVHLGRCHEQGVPVARRSSGGGTVLLGPGTFCVSIIRPLREFRHDELGVRELQVKALKDLADKLHWVKPELCVSGSGDWSIGSRKCAGSAQRRMKTHVLVHLCVMNNMPLGEVSRYLPMPRRMPEYREGRTHENFLVNLGVSDSIFLQSVSANWVNSQQIQEIPLAVRQMADELANDRFRLNEWTERF